ncbi:MAG: ABC transporter ATP-binding protein [Micropruina sp.]|uniref:ABC transporter ATP-binding protein n=1 Tax=Micropruina sp. TaxID=2737536 RepID=UPI0039E419A8
MTAFLAVHDIAFSYRAGYPIFTDLSFQLGRGELFTILGPNGAGKSTLLNCVTAVRPPQHGRILLDGAPVAELPPRTRARAIAYVPQTSTVSYAYSVLEYVLMGRAPHLNLMQQPSAGDRARAHEALDLLGIADLARRPCTQISGGQRQLASIAKAIVQDPELIVFDEPTAALDHGNQARVLHLLADLSRRGFGIISTTHNPNHAILLGGSAGVLTRTGRLHAGPVAEVIREDLLSRVYETELRVVYVEELGRTVCETPALTKPEPTTKGRALP